MLGTLSLRSRVVGGLAVAVILVCAGCGESHEGGDGGDGDGRSPGRDSGTLVADCPERPPMTGDRCDRRGLSCEYGDDWSPRCNTLAQCWIGGPLDGTWQVREPSATSCPTPTSLGAGCPATPPSGSCTPSDPTGLCVYETARCLCFADESDPGGPTTYMWQCQASPEAGCPAERPRVGSACSSEGLTCTYAVCLLGGGTYCTDGAWSEAIVPNLCGGGMG